METETKVNNESVLETGQTGQEEQNTRRGAFEVQQNEDGQWEWSLVSHNGQLVAISPKEWERRNDCTNAVAAVKKLIENGVRTLIMHKGE